MNPSQASNESSESGKSNNNECPVPKRVVIGGGENSYFMPYKRLAGIVSHRNVTDDADDEDDYGTMASRHNAAAAVAAAGLAHHIAASKNNALRRRSGGGSGGGGGGGGGGGVRGFSINDILAHKTEALRRQTAISESSKTFQVDGSLFIGKKDNYDNFRIVVQLIFSHIGLYK